MDEELLSRLRLVPVVYPKGIQARKEFDNMESFRYIVQDTQTHKLCGHINFHQKENELFFYPAQGSSLSADNLFVLSRMVKRLNKHHGFQKEKSHV